MAPNPNEPSRHFYSLDEYFALERAVDARYEYWDGDIFCMSGGSKAHGRIASNVHYRLRTKLEGGPCVAYTGDTAVKTPSLLPYRYPDVTVGCGDIRFENMRGVDALLNPILIVEVLSPSTDKRDREDKFSGYKAISSFEEYLLIAQDTPRVIRFSGGQNRGWEREEAAGVESTLKLVSIGCILSLREIYEGVDFIEHST